MVKAIQGDSAFSPQMLAGLIDEAEAKVAEQKEICDAAEQAVRGTELLQKNLSARYNEMISWAELYDGASIASKKMIVNSLIRRINVFKDYQLEIEFNFDLRQFFIGLDMKLPERITA